MATPIPRNIYSQKRVKKTPSGNSLTIQSQAEGTKIQNIIAKYQKTGYIEQQSKAPQFLDTTQIGDLQQAQQQLIDTKNYFMSLKPEIRAKFDNDIVKLVQFMQNPSNLDESIALGLQEKPEGYKSPQEIAEEQARLELEKPTE